MEILKYIVHNLKRSTRKDRLDELYAIGDLHFSTLVEKPMNIFGDKWEKHEEKIISSWKDNVKEDDVVLVLGDTSWGINLTEAKPDLDIISNLCGNKNFYKRKS